jgi:hypothetical protein
MTPTNVASGLGEGLTTRVLAEPGRAYAVYICESAKKVEARPRTTAIALRAPAGRYRVEWLSTQTGKILNRERRDHKEGPLQLTSPEFSEDVALRLRR